jgi:hypothetical protein
MWICRDVVVAGNLRKEIDASFIIEDILFVLEAKSVNVSFGYDKGDKQSIDFRTNKMKNALKESNEKVEFIYNHQVSIFPKIPDNIRYLCPLVISSHPEFIWSKSEDLFISEEHELPRVITIGDIKNLRNIDLNLLRRKNWIISLR